MIEFVELMIEVLLEEQRENEFDLGSEWECSTVLQGHNSDRYQYCRGGVKNSGQDWRRKVRLFYDFEEEMFAEALLRKGIYIFSDALVNNEELTNILELVSRSRWSEV